MSTAGLKCTRCSEHGRQETVSCHDDVNTSGISTWESVVQWLLTEMPMATHWKGNLLVSNRNG